MSFFFAPLTPDALPAEPGLSDHTDIPPMASPVASTSSRALDDHSACALLRQRTTDLCTAVARLEHTISRTQALLARSSALLTRQNGMGAVHHATVSERAQDEDVLGPAASR